MNTRLKTTTLLICSLISIISTAQTILTNPYSRNNTELLNGKWNALIDLFCMGESNGAFRTKPNHRQPAIKC
jgi:hypothetical protein